MQPIWLNDWKDFNTEKLEVVFGLEKDELKDIEILLASYKESDDSGYAFILLRSDQKLYEVNASHDSAIDFQDQWQPEETSIEVLLHRLNIGNLGSAESGENIFAQPLKKLFSKLMQ